MMDTALENQVAADLDRDEGFREFAYPDPLSKLYAKYPKLKWGYRPAKELLAELGVKVNLDDGAPWTYGYGFTSGVTPDSRISKPDAVIRLKKEIRQVDADLRSKRTWYDSASFVTKTILINMAFNMGVAGLLGFKNTLKYVQDKSYKQAATNMRKSLWYKQVTARAERLAKRMETQSL